MRSVVGPRVFDKFNLTFGRTRVKNTSAPMWPRVLDNRERSLVGCGKQQWEHLAEQ